MMGMFLYFGIGLTLIPVMIVLAGMSLPEDDEQDFDDYCICGGGLMQESDPEYTHIWICIICGRSYVREDSQ